MNQEAVTGRMTIADLSQLIEDLYYQDFKQRDAFIGQEHISPLIGMAYARILNEEYKTNKLLMKSMVGYSFVELSQDWLETETITLTKDETTGDVTGELSRPLFFFDFDSMSSAVQSVRATTNKDCNPEMIRVALNDEWKYKKMPFTNKVFYFVATTKGIRFMSQGCLPKSVQVRYIPNLFPVNEATTIPMTRADQIAKEVLQLLLGAKNGTIVDKTNNSNPNVLPQTELDADSIRNQ